MPYQCARIYRLRPGATGRVVAAARQSLAPTLQSQTGFMRYRLQITADDRAVSASVWDTDAQAAFADMLESDWVRDHVSDDLDGLPDSLIGPIEVDTGGLD